MDYEQLFNYGESGKFVNTVVEIPKGSNIKVEFDRATKAFLVDRIEPSIFAKPANYGFIPQTTDEDNDPLDTLILTNHPLTTGLVVKAKVIGVLRFVDDGENDHKILCVAEDDRDSAVSSLAEVDEKLKQQIEHHFNHYKDLKAPGSTIVKGWGDEKEAWQVVEASSQRFKGSSQ